MIFLVSGRIADTISGPIEMLGTKCPSITSTWIYVGPAASMARISSPSRVKSADRIDGAIRIRRVMGQLAGCRVEDRD